MSRSPRRGEGSVSSWGPIGLLPPEVATGTPQLPRGSQRRTTQRPHSPGVGVAGPDPAGVTPKPGRRCQWSIPSPCCWFAPMQAFVVLSTSGAHLEIGTPPCDLKPSRLMAARAASGGLRRARNRFSFAGRYAHALFLEVHRGRARRAGPIFVVIRLRRRSGRWHRRHRKR